MSGHFSFNMSHHEYYPQRQPSDPTTADGLPLTMFGSIRDAPMQKNNAFQMPEKYTKKVRGKLPAKPFPLKLMEILAHKEYEDIVTWLQDGKSFKILKPKEFTAVILPKHLKEAKYSTFKRKMSCWGFQREQEKVQGGNAKCYGLITTFSHPFFQRNRADLLDKVTFSKKSPPAKLVDHTMSNSSTPAKLEETGSSTRPTKQEKASMKITPIKSQHLSMSAFTETTPSMATPLNHTTVSAVTPADTHCTLKTPSRPEYMALDQILKPVSTTKSPFFPMLSNNSKTLTSSAEAVAHFTNDFIASSSSGTPKSTSKQHTTPGRLTDDSMFATLLPAAPAKSSALIDSTGSSNKGSTAASDDRYPIITDWPFHRNSTQAVSSSGTPSSVCTPARTIVSTYSATNSSQTRLHPMPDTPVDQPATPASATHGQPRTPFTPASTYNTKSNKFRNEVGGMHQPLSSMQSPSFSPFLSLFQSPRLPPRKRFTPQKKSPGTYKGYSLLSDDDVLKALSSGTKTNRITFPISTEKHQRQQSMASPARVVFQSSSSKTEKRSMPSPQRRLPSSHTNDKQNNESRQSLFDVSSSYLNNETVQDNEIMSFSISAEPTPLPLPPSTKNTSRGRSESPFPFQAEKQNIQEKSTPGAKSPLPLQRKKKKRRRSTSTSAFITTDNSTFPIPAEKQDGMPSPQHFFELSNSTRGDTRSFSARPVQLPSPRKRKKRSQRPAKMSRLKSTCHQNHHNGATPRRNFEGRTTTASHPPATPDKYKSRSKSTCHQNHHNGATPRRNFEGRTSSASRLPATPDKYKSTSDFPSRLPATPDKYKSTSELLPEESPSNPCVLADYSPSSVVSSSEVLSPLSRISKTSTSSASTSKTSSDNSINSKSHNEHDCSPTKFSSKDLLPLSFPALTPSPRRPPRKRFLPPRIDSPKEERQTGIQTRAPLSPLKSPGSKLLSKIVAPSSNNANSPIDMNASSWMKELIGANTPSVSATEQLEVDPKINSTPYTTLRGTPPHRKKKERSKKRNLTLLDEFAVEATAAAVKAAETANKKAPASLSMLSPLKLSSPTPTALLPFSPESSSNKNKTDSKNQWFILLSPGKSRSPKKIQPKFDRSNHGYENNIHIQQEVLDAPKGSQNDIDRVTLERDYFKKEIERIKRERDDYKRRYKEELGRNI